MQQRRQLSELFRYYPWLAKGLISLYRLTQPRFSIGAAGVLLNDQRRVLLVKHAFHIGNPWGLPGGWIGRNESPEEALRREFYEELRLSITVGEPLLAQSGVLWRNHLDLIYKVAANLPLTDIHLSYELTDYAWHSPDDLPPLKDFQRRVLEKTWANGPGN